MLTNRILPGVLAALLAGAVNAATPSVHPHGFYVVVPLEERGPIASEGISVALSNASLPGGIVGIPYDGFNFMTSLSVSGDEGYTGYGVKWTLVSGNLPDGLTLGADGQLTGTPTASGTSSFQLRATYKTKTGEQAYQVVVGKITVDIAAGSPPQAIVGQAYSYDLKPLLAVSGDPAYAGTGVTWSVVSSSLPAGLALRADGTIAGTPTAGGTGTVVARATYRNGAGEQAYEVVSLPIKVGLASSVPPQGIVGQAYSYDLTSLLSVTGDGAYRGAGVTWTSLSDNLPEGLSLRTDGTIAGTPKVAGSGYITVRASYRGVNNEQAYEVVTLAINVSLGTATPPQAIVGQTYSFDLKGLLSVTGDSAYTGSGITWSVVSDSLPAGLSLRADGTIAGVPTASGTGGVTARATYRGVNGQQAYQVVSLDIKALLSKGTPPQAIVGQTYTYDLKPLLNVTGDGAYNGSGVTWTVVSSSLPAGLHLNTDGTIGGTPTAAGTGAVTARATYRGNNGEQSYQVVSLAINVSLAVGAPPQAIAGQAYSYDLKALLTVTGDTAYTGSGVSWSVVSSDLPTGLQLLSDGTISGTPTSAGTGSVKARATYRNVKGEQTYQVVSLAITVALGSATPPQAIVGQAYRYDLKPLLNVTGDNAYDGSGVTWTVVSNSLAAGLQLNADGTISGTPTASGTGSLTARATYRGVNGQQAYQVVTLGINVSLSTATLPQAIAGQVYTYDLKPLLSVSGDSAYNISNVTWTVVSNGLPSGLQLLSNGLISGTPTGSGTGTLTARATYRGVNGQQAYQVVTLAINVSLASATLPEGRVGESYSYDIKPLVSVSGDSAYTSTSQLSWSVVANSLPAGLTLTTGGTITGTPTVATTGSVTARATYRNVSGQQGFSITTNPAWTYMWLSSGWTVPAGCGTVTETRSAACQRSDGTIVADGSCVAASKPATSASVTNYSACSYAWQATGWNTPAACGATTATRTVSCLRSDGTTVSDVSCQATSRPAESTGAMDYSTCSYSWQASGWTTPAACGSTTATRSVSCLRSDGTFVADGSCPAASKPATTTTTTSYSTCSYAWTAGGWNTPAACGSTTATRSVSCLRSDGTTVADGSCPAASKPATTTGSTDYSTCSYAWTASGWNTPAACGSTTATRSVSCLRSDGTTVADGSCPAASKPATTTGTTDYSTCSYAWSAGGWNTPAACGATTATRSVSCLRSDGTTVADESCPAASKPATTTGTTNYSTCSYAWSAGGWNTPAACGATTATRSVSCVRSDGTTVADGSCAAGTKPATSTGTSDYSACSYSWNYSGWSTPSACGATTASRSVWCQRSDGSTVADASCGAGKPATTTSTTSYSACSYSWNYGGWSTPAACGGTTATRSVWCQRSDGATVSGASCSGAAPASSTSTTDYSACSYSWQTGAWSNPPAACGATTQSRSVWCQRSDGSTVSGGYCSGAAPASTTTSTNYSACTYSMQYGDWGACSASCGGGVQYRWNTCWRSDGTVVADANCGTPVTSQSCNTQACVVSHSWGGSASQGCMYNSEANSLPKSGTSGSCTTAGSKYTWASYVGSCGPGSYLKMIQTCN